MLKARAQKNQPEFKRTENELKTIFLVGNGITIMLLDVNCMQYDVWGPNRPRETARPPPGERMSSIAMGKIMLDTSGYILASAT